MAKYMWSCNRMWACNWGCKSTEYLLYP